MLEMNSNLLIHFSGFCEVRTNSITYTCTKSKMHNRSSTLNTTLTVPYVPDSLMLLCFRISNQTALWARCLYLTALHLKKTRSDFQYTLTYIKQTKSCYLSSRKLDYSHYSFRILTFNCLVQVQITPGGHTYRTGRHHLFKKEQLTLLPKKNQETTFKH